jgi:UDP-N-acetylmuramyl pentapeptide phosphotransferase/UDP-N-acetylglucosamine-1-phosphate transferase
VSDFSLLLCLIAAAMAALLAYGGIASVIGWLRERALARPNQRSSHTVPTPQGGGIVVVPTALLAAGVALAVHGYALPGGTLYLSVICTAALALTIIGFIDDTRGLTVWTRLASQAVGVAVAILLMPADLRVLPSLIPLPLERAGLIAAALWFVNLVNFMDGIDLISAVETIAISIGIAVLAAFGAIPPLYGYIAVALAGAMVGFAPWNSPPARLFLGDAGSIPIGFLLAILLIHVGAADALAAAVILPLYYLADASLTLVRRLLRGERIWEAHRTHFYQQATQNGMTVVETVGHIAVLNAVLIALAVGSAVHGRFWAGIAGLIAATAVGLTLRTFARGKT